MKQRSIRGDEKRCPSCHQFLPFTEFNANKQNAHGLQCYCKKCSREKRDKVIQNRKRLGLCISCGNPSKEYVLCESCRSKNNKSRKISIRKKIAGRRCIRCGVQLSDDHKTQICDPCNNKDKLCRLDRKERIRSAGLCLSCRRPSDQVQCPECNKKQYGRIRPKVDKARKGKICTRCRKAPASPGFRRCEACRAKTALLERNRHKRKQ